MKKNISTREKKIFLFMKRNRLCTFLNSLTSVYDYRVEQ